MTGLVLAIALAQEPAVFRARVEYVYVDVFVTKENAPVSGLEAGDFRVEDDGVPQRIEVVDRRLEPTTAVLVLDASASVAGSTLVHLKEAARAFVAGLAELDEAALVTFDHRVALQQDAGRDRAAGAAAVDRVTAGGGTRLIDSLYVCLKKTWGTGRPLVVLFTDGQDSASWLENEDVLQAARESTALLHVVGTEALPEHRRPVLLPQGRVESPAESGYVYLLRRAAETTGGAYWAVDSVAALPTAFLGILQAANARYVLRYEPAGVARVGRHRLKVSVRRRGLKVQARQEYFVSGAAPR